MHVVDWTNPDAVRVLAEEDAQLLEAAASVATVNFGEDLTAGAGAGAEAAGRRACLPAGIWSGWWTRRRVRGLRWLPAEHGLDTMPLSLREGAVVPIGPVVRQGGQRPTDALTVAAAPGQVALDAPAGVELRP